MPWEGAGGAGLGEESNSPSRPRLRGAAVGLGFAGAGAGLGGAGAAAGLGLAAWSALVFLPFALPLDAGAEGGGGVAVAGFAGGVLAVAGELAGLAKIPSRPRLRGAVEGGVWVGGVAAALA